MPRGRAPTGSDRLLPFTKAGFAPLIPLTAIFGPALVLFAGSTDDFWAWEIKPAASAAFLGTGYVFGSITITTMLVLGRWRSAIVPVISTFPFSVGLLVATLIHVDRFFTDSIRFWIWFVIYAALPVFLPAAWLLNHRQDPGPQPGEPHFPAPLALTIAAAGAALTGLGLVMFASPSTVEPFWPWPLTPLMAQIVASWLLFWGAAALCLLPERRLAAYRPFLPTAVVFPVILLVVSFAYADDFSAPWAWRAVLVGIALAELGLVAYVERRMARGRPSSAALS